jgi:hypothetical protein
MKICLLTLGQCVHQAVSYLQMHCMLIGVHMHMHNQHGLHGIFLS